MADIWLAQEFGPRGYERTAVVKTIRADLTDEEELIQMLVEEARIAACLEHPNIVELYEVGQEEETHYLAMEFVFGRDLRQIRDHCLEHKLKIPHEHIVTIIAGVLDALHYAYNEATYEGRPMRVIHRDVSPQNIIVGFDGTVKLQRQPLAHLRLISHSFLNPYVAVIFRQLRPLGKLSTAAWLKHMIWRDLIPFAYIT